MLVVFDNRIGQLLPREVLLGPLLIILILGPVQGLPVLVEHGSLLGQAAGLGVRCLLMLSILKCGVAVLGLFKNTYFWKSI